MLGASHRGHLQIFQNLNVYGFWCLLFHLYSVGSQTKLPDLLDEWDTGFQDHSDRSAYHLIARLDLNGDRFLQAPIECTLRCGGFFRIFIFRDLDCEVLPLGSITLGGCIPFV